MRDDELLRQYLLGALPDAEEETLERRLLAEEELFDLAEAVESEILEDYARGGPELSQTERAHVARYLAASPSGRLRLAVVRGLTALSATGRVLPFQRPDRTVLRPKDRILVAAAMLLMALGAVIGIRITIQPPSVVVVQQPPTPAAPTAPERIAEHRPPAPPVPAPPPPPVIFTAATMILSSVRGEEEITSVQVPAGTDVVKMPLQLPGGYETYPSYQVLLQSRGQTLLSFQDLHARKSLLTVEIDAEQLRTGRYTFEVSGVDRDGSVNVIEFKEFEVRNP